LQAQKLRLSVLLRVCHADLMMLMLIGGALMITAMILIIALGLSVGLRSTQDGRSSTRSLNSPDLKPTMYHDVFIGDGVGRYTRLFGWLLFSLGGFCVAAGSVLYLRQ
jgi:hypothetical protein